MSAESRGGGGGLLGGLLTLIGKDASFWAKVRGVEIALTSMSQQERAALFEAIDKRFCLDCGKQFETSGDTCHCEGDDDGKKVK